MWRCPQCETYNQDNSNFCAVCGFAKPAPEMPEPVTPAAAEAPAEVEYYYTEAETEAAFQDMEETVYETEPSYAEAPEVAVEPDETEEPEEERTSFLSGMLATILGLAVAAAMIFLFLNGTAMADEAYAEGESLCICAENIEN
ncbi:MAG: hypothetical protein IJC56_09525 [Clostridia bacterium]|nr:hypothetical protein [Clostridia bacterium]